MNAFIILSINTMIYLENPNLAINKHYPINLEKI